MKKFAFISRHQPTGEQLEIAEKMGIEIIHVGDTDAFNVYPGWVYDHGAFEGVIVVHPAMALNLASSFEVGVFNNINRAPIGEKPDFHTTDLMVWDLRD